MTPFSSRFKLIHQNRYYSVTKQLRQKKLSGPVVSLTLVLRSLFLPIILATVWGSKCLFCKASCLFVVVCNWRWSRSKRKMVELKMFHNGKSLAPEPSFLCKNRGAGTHWAPPLQPSLEYTFCWVYKKWWSRKLISYNLNYVFVFCTYYQVEQ